MTRITAAGVIYCHYATLSFMVISCRYLKKWKINDLMTVKPHDAKQMTAQPNDPDDKCQIIDAKSRTEGGWSHVMDNVRPWKGH